MPWAGWNVGLKKGVSGEKSLEKCPLLVMMHWFELGSRYFPSFLVGGFLPQNFRVLGHACLCLCVFLFL